MHLYRRVLPVLIAAVPAIALAGFPSTELFFPAVGRVAGSGGSQFYTTVWVTDLAASPAHITFDFLQQGQDNSVPKNFTDTLQPGETKVYEDVIETKLQLTGVLGAGRIVSDQEVFAAERIFNQFSGDPLEKSVGLFFAGVPGSFSIAAGQSATIQGVDQGGSENFRYNFALVETGGASTTVHVALLSNTGVVLGSKDYTLKPYEQEQPNVSDLVANIGTTNARITATVTGGAGRVLLAGAQLANASQDSSGFEMTFPEALLGGGSFSLPFHGTASSPGPVFSIENTNSSSTAVGIQGIATGTFLNSSGVLGVLLPASVVTIQDRAGVIGISDESNGVLGASAGGIGVVGITSSLSPSASGIFGSNSGNGIGVFASSNAGPAILAAGPGDSGVALRLQTGGIQVLGAGVNSTTPVFIHKVKTGAGGNICATKPYATVVDHPASNGNPGAILIVTPNYGAVTSGTAPPIEPMGVFYDDTNTCGAGAKWVIYDVAPAQTPLLNNQLFNVLVIRP
jgi:hypothetical protein